MYNISLSDISEFTVDTLDKVKLVAYLLYDALLDYEYENGKNVLYKDSIILNELYDNYNQYDFEHTDYNKGLYEPFMINDTSFGFTVYEESISNQEISNLIREIKGIINFNGNFNINCITLKDKRDRLNMFNTFYPKPKTKNRKLKLAGLFL